MSAETLLAWTIRNSEYELKEVPELQNSTGRLIKILGCKHLLLFVKKEWWFRRQNQGPRGYKQVPRRQKWEPQKTVSRPWNLIKELWLEYDQPQLDSKFLLDLWFCFTFHFPALKKKKKNSNVYILCLHHDCLLGLVGADNLFHGFQKSRDGEEFCPKVLFNGLLIDTLFRRLGWWNFGLWTDPVTG